MPQGITLAEQGHIVNVLPPIDISAGKTGDRFKMTNYGHATIIVQVGVSAAAFTKIILKECNAASGGTATAIAFDYYAEETAAGDTLAARASATSSGVTPSANNNIMYVIEIDARALSDGFEWLELSVTNTTNSVIASAIAILTGGRHQNAQTATAIA